MRAKNWLLSRKIFLSDERKKHEREKLAVENKWKMEG
jgi:hypothetical protein